MAEPIQTHFELTAARFFGSGTVRLGQDWIELRGRRLEEAAYDSLVRRRGVLLAALGALIVAAAGAGVVTDGLALPLLAAALAAVLLTWLVARPVLYPHETVCVRLELAELADTRLSVSDSRVPMTLLFGISGLFLGGKSQRVELKAADGAGNWVDYSLTFDRVEDFVRVGGAVTRAA